MIGLIERKVNELTTMLTGTAKIENGEITISKNGTACEILYNEKFVFMTVNVNNKNYKKVHDYIFENFIPSLVGVNQYKVRDAIAYNEMDELVEVVVNGHNIEFCYGYNFITFKVFTTKNI